ncbi:DNA-3-methyladenine glycosylase I [Neokomagataea anthophila]|uniref:DNA-3-methyladenine glycosylase I n=1 Tax=Neokomagataea anthophila TaxID=2826925 RepID=A0ABS5E5A8_9PROT|nr:DNA-3-methyladenine glycosylase I [Neokomagataea anthophila]
MTSRPRCTWAEATPLLQHYHDEEWGNPITEDRALWESLILEGFQAGLSWRIILERRTALRTAFAHFIPEKLIHFTQHDVERLMQDKTIIRSRAKITSVISNARAYLDMRTQGESLNALLKHYIPQYPITNHSEAPLTQSPLSQEIASALKKRGFKFVGPTIVYSWLQAIGRVNDHEPQCYAWRDNALTSQHNK